jgi:hypothetical protein
MTATRRHVSWTRSSASWARIGADGPLSSGGCNEPNTRTPPVPKPTMVEWIQPVGSIDVEVVHDAARDKIHGNRPVPVWRPGEPMPRPGPSR